MLCLQGNKTCHCREFTGMSQGGCCVIESSDVLHLHLCLLEKLPLKVKLDCKYKHWFITLASPFTLCWLSFSAATQRQSIHGR